MSVIAYALTAYKAEEPAHRARGAETSGSSTRSAAYLTLTGIGPAVRRATGGAGLRRHRRAPGTGTTPLVVAALSCWCGAGFLVQGGHRAVSTSGWPERARPSRRHRVCVLFSGVMVELGSVRRRPHLLGDLRRHRSPTPPYARALATPRHRVRRCWAAVMCLLQRHIKRLLAYSTISHAGLLLLGGGRARPRTPSPGPPTTCSATRRRKSALFLGAGRAAEPVRDRGRARTARPAAGRCE